MEAHSTPPTDVASYNYAFDNFGIAQSYASYGTVLGGNANEQYHDRHVRTHLMQPSGAGQVGDSFEAERVGLRIPEQRFSVLEGPR